MFILMLVRGRSSLTNDGFVQSDEVYELMNERTNE